MERKGSALAQMIFAILFLIIVVTVFASQMRLMVPTMLVILGPFLIITGFIVKEQSISAVGIMLLALAIVYANAVL